VDVDEGIVMHCVVLGTGVRRKRAIIDRYSKIELGACIGYDSDGDRRRFTGIDSGIVVMPRGRGADTWADDMMSRYS
jgi:ADP-glucose pyrophosphorylase